MNIVISIVVRSMIVGTLWQVYISIIRVNKQYFRLFVITLIRSEYICKVIAR